MLFEAHLFGLALTAAVSAVAARWVYGRTRGRAGRVMVILLATHVVMAAFTGAELLSSSLGWMIFWKTLWYSFVLANPVLWLLLAIYYTGRDHWLTRPARAILVAAVAIPVALLVTNPVHELLFVDYRIATEPFAHRVTTETTVLRVVLWLVHVNTFLGIGLFLRTFLLSRRTARVQTAAILVGMVVVFGTSLGAQERLGPVDGFPYGVFGAGFFGVVVAVALFRTRLFAVAPLARDVVLDELEEGVIVVDANRAIVDFNAAAVDLLPALESHLGDDLEDAYPSFLRRASSATNGGGAEAIVESADGPFAGSVRLTTSDGARTLRVGVSEIESGGEHRGYALVVRDVTELERYATELEHKTAQLERFASTLSHDLRNPVSVATGYVDLERERRDSERLRYAGEALERIDETIDDLLALAREGEQIEAFESVSLSTVADEAWRTSATGQATFENDLGGDRILADPSRLRRLLENLFRNAVDHGGETVLIGPLSEEDRRGFYVADDGPGIPEGERERVFEYGYSSDPESTGLGMAIVSSIATAHGWSASVAESEWNGARIEIDGVEWVSETGSPVVESRSYGQTDDRRSLE